MKYMDLTEFRDSGLLQEVNRLFFHPRGLALEVNCDEPDKNGHRVTASLGGIQDFRDDPEGVWMTMTDSDIVRAQLLAEDYDRRKVERYDRLGFVEQPLVVQGKEHPKTGASS